MRQTGLLRTLALFATIGLSGQIAAPVLDGVLYHSHGEARQQSHWDPAGGCKGHGDRCELGSLPVGPRLGTSAALRGVAPPAPSKRAALAASQTPPRSPARPQHGSRAPPIALG